MNAIKRVVSAIDRTQQRHSVLGVAFAVQKKYGDDSAGILASVLAFSGFVTLFPLLLLLVTVLGLVLASHPHVRSEILNSTFAQFPLMGSELRANVHALHRNSLIGLIVAIVLLFYCSLGLAGNGISTMEQIWNLPGGQRVNFRKRTGRSVEFIALLGTGLIVSTFLSGLATNSASRPFVIDALAVLGSLAVSIGQFILAYRVLTPAVVSTRGLLPGAIAAGIGWTVLQALGTYLVGHQLRNAAVYGVFAFVLGLVFWISLVVRVVVYSAELNVVLARRLWPRSIVPSPLTEADLRVLAAQAEQNRRRPEQQVHAIFDDEDGADGERPGPSGDLPAVAGISGESSPAARSKRGLDRPRSRVASSPFPGRRGASSQGPG